MSASEMKLNLAKPGVDAEADAYRPAVAAASGVRARCRRWASSASWPPGGRWWRSSTSSPSSRPRRAWCCKRCDKRDILLQNLMPTAVGPPGIPARQSAGGAAGDGVRAQQDVAGDFLSGRRHDQFDPDRRQGADPGADHGQRHRAKDHDRRHGVLLPHAGEHGSRAGRRQSPVAGADARAVGQQARDLQAAPVQLAALSLLGAAHRRLHVGDRRGGRRMDRGHGRWAP